MPMATEIILTDPLEGTDGAQKVAKEIYQSNREKYFYPDQYNNPANWLAHYKTTAKEIWDQTEGNITHGFWVRANTGSAVSGTVNSAFPITPCHAATP